MGAEGIILSKSLIPNLLRACAIVQCSSEQLFRSLYCSRKSRSLLRRLNIRKIAFLLSPISPSYLNSWNWWIPVRPKSLYRINQLYQQEVSAAAEKLEQRRRGWTTEEDKKMKIFNLPKVNKAFYNSSSFFESSYGTNFMLCNVISSCDVFEEQCKGCRLIFKIYFPSFTRNFGLIKYLNGHKSPG